MTLRFAPSLVIAVAVCAPAVLAQQKLVAAQSEIVFVSKQMGVPVEGRFKKFNAQIAFDPKRPDASKIAFTIDLASARLGAPETEAELVKPGWFNSQKVPQATFASTTIKATAPNAFDVAGALTIKGVARPVVVPVVLASAAGGNTTASGAFTLRRADFKIGEGEWSDTSIVANEVQVRFTLTLTGVAPI